MTIQLNTAQVWRFGVFEVDARNLELRRNGVPIRIREQSFRVLVYLLEHAGQLVSREDLRRVLWPADTFVDFDHSLNTAVMKMRDALGDVADSPVYIETIPKRGYRFIAPVTHPSEPPAQTASDVPMVPTPIVPTIGGSQFPASIATLPQTRPSLRHHPVMVALALLFLVSIATIALLLFRRPGGFRSADAHQRELLRTVPITSAAGDAVYPVFSPDGREIAYAWDGSDRRGYDLYVQLIGADLPLRLTYHQRGLVGPPAWSPDGREIAFQRCDGKHDGVFAVPALGGEERQLTSVACLYTLPNPLAWIVNGTEMLMVDRCTPGGPFGVVDLSLATGAKRCVTNSGAAGNEDTGYGFALSPDGSTLAFGRTTVSLCCDIYRMPLIGGPATHITPDGDIGCNTLSGFGCSGFMWTPDGRSLIYVNDRSPVSSLLRVSADGGPSERETTYPALGSFTSNGTHFAYSEHTSTDPPAIWRAEFSAPGGSLLGKNKIISSQSPELDAQPSPDGTRIVWMSMRTGSEEIFLADTAGHNQSQLTHLGHYSGTPRWSPDSKWIAFDSYQPGGHAEIFLVDPEGRNVHPVISGSFDCAVPSWSRDGKSIYYSANRNGVWQVWKHNLESETNVQITQQGGFNGLESADGKTVYYTRFYEAGLWKISSPGGAETIVVPDRPQIGFWGHFAVTVSGLYVLDDDAEPHPTIEFYNFATQRISPVLTLDERPARLQPSLSAAADGKILYFTQYDRQSVIKMMEFAP